MAESLVSVVIPTYDRPEALRRAVDSVAAQTYEHLELVVVDDHSPDPVEDSLADADRDRFDRVRCLRHEENRGGAAARATGIEAAGGEYVAFLDDDDRWVDRKVATQVAALEDAGPAAGVAYTGMRIVDADGETIRTQRATHAGDLTKTLLCRNVVGSYSTVLVRRTAIDDVGLPDARFPSWQDLEWYVRLSRECEFVACPEPLAVVQGAADRDRISDDFEAIASEAYPLFLENFRHIAAEYGPRFERKMRAWAAFRVGGYNALRTGHVGAARRYLLRAVRLYPLEATFWIYLAVAMTGDRGYRLATWLKRRLAAYA